MVLLLLSKLHPGKYLHVHYKIPVYPASDPVINILKNVGHILLGTGPVPKTDSILKVKDKNSLFQFIDM